MNKIFLREIEKSDMSKINSWRNDPELIGLLGANFIYISNTIDERWFESYLSNREKSVRLAIIDINTDKHIGNVNLTNIHAINKSAEFSIFIGDKTFWSSGSGSEATKSMLKHGFCDLNLNRIYLTVIDGNERALKLYKRIGFREEGLQRQAVFKNGSYLDVIEMSILKSDFTC